jgi:thiamine monophosphate kinase
MPHEPVGPPGEGVAGRFGLTDDSAVIVAAAGHEFAAKIDALSTDSHFLAGAPLDLVAYG